MAPVVEDADLDHKQCELEGRWKAESDSRGALAQIYNPIPSVSPPHGLQGRSEQL